MPEQESQKKNSARWRLIGGLVVLTLIQLVSYQNCGSDFVVKDGLNLASSASTCEASLEAEFESSYYSFLKTNCVTCHSGAGPGQGAFASNNPDVAFAAFLAAGTDKIDANATNSAHAGGYTGSQNTSADTLASQQWAAAEATCQSNAGGGGSTPTVITNAKAMNATTTAKDIVWNLDTDVASGSIATGGATLTIAVLKMPSANGAPVYYFSNPRLKAGTKSVTLSGLMIRINDQEQTLGSTWSRVSGTAAAGATNVLSTAQLILEYDAATSTDTLSLAIDSLAAQ